MHLESHPRRHLLLHLIASFNLRDKTSHHAKSQVRRFNFGPEVFAIRDVEHCDACRVPRAAAQDSFARHVIVIAIVIVNVRMPTVVRAIE